MSTLRLLACTVTTALTCCACAGTPTEPRDTTLPTGRWTSDGACLMVTEQTCDLIAGCGHGQFPRPTLRPDGSFDVDGTYRIEIGPVSIEPAPAAHFSGLLSGTTLTLRVVPGASGVSPASYTMKPGGTGICGVRCL